MYGTSGDNTIFTYDIERLYLRVKNRTATRVKMVRDEKGQKTYDDLALTDQERSDFNVLLPRAVAAVFRSIQSLAQGIDDAYSIGEDSTSSTITFTVLLPEFWDSNITDIMDNQIESVLEYFIVREWFHMAGLMQLVAEINLLYTDAVSDLKGSVLNRTTRNQRKYRIL